MFHIKGFCPSITQDLLNKALGFASEYIYISKPDIGLINHARNQYCLIALITGLRNNKVCLMCRWELMMELNSASSWAYIC